MIKICSHFYISWKQQQSSQRKEKSILKPETTLQVQQYLLLWSNHWKCFPLLKTAIYPQYPYPAPYHICLLHIVLRPIYKQNGFLY